MWRKSQYFSSTSETFMSRAQKKTQNFGKFCQKNREKTDMLACFRRCSAFTTNDYVQNVS